MRWKGLRPYSLALLPLALGLLLSVAFRGGWLGLANTQQRATFDLAWVSGMGGLLLTVLGVTAVATQARLHQSKEKSKQLTETAAQAENREFLRRLDHELKNPLTIIRLGIVNLQQSDALDDAQQQSLTRIAEQTERLRQLVIDLRRLTELEAADLESAPVDLADVLTEAVSLAEEAWQQDRTVTLTLQETPWPIATIQGDRELLILAFRNLIDNGLKYTAPADRVDVRASDNGQTAVIEVADNGMGIPKHELRQVFDNLYRGEQARGIPGSGLGLPMVKRIVTLHGGSVDVRSRNQTGTIFTVRLPYSRV
ncbi:sensor histidine kinase [Candidatus Leptofilum sp.]|uniref:sensor histidine kinase n=1 Tax=Candidatus Leptofilum sp. TaxID=3241576 RepID=UPI003B59A096